jgi:DNA-binding NtrC family response regulator
VGGTTPLQVDARVVAATNRNLRVAVAARQFREDLYFRLSVFPITIPPLRERTDDIPRLARYFVDRFCRDQNKKSMALAPSAIEQLQAYRWPGNVRELQNCMERAVILTEGDTIHGRHLNLSVHAALTAPLEPADPFEHVDLSGSLAEVVRRVVSDIESRKIEHTLKEASGDRGHTADMLQISYKALTAKLKEYGLEADLPLARFPSA